MDYTGAIDGRLLQGCYQEAERSRVVALNLDGLRNAMAESYHAHIFALSEEIRTTSAILRDIADRSQVHFSRVPVVLDYLNVVLPCLSRSLRDITTFYEDIAVSKEIRWRRMYHKMTSEVGGIPLPQRFVLYNHFLTVLLQLLIRCGFCPSHLILAQSARLIMSRDVNFELNTLESLKTRILELREKRGIGRFKSNMAELTMANRR